MSYAIMRLEKRNSKNIVGMFRHNERKTENHSNEDINKDLSHLNYQLIKCDSYSDKINKEIKDRYKVNKSIRKDAVLCVEVLFTSDKNFFEKLTPEQEKIYFEKSVEFLKEQFGEKNVVFATVHKDETTPHLHAGFIPMTDDGRLNYKSFVNGRDGLIKLQNEYYEKMVELFPELERGQNAKETKAKHIANQEYKIQQKEKAMELQLEQINKNAMELEEKKKKLEAKKERLKLEDEKLYSLESITKHVKESKSFLYKDKITVSMDKEIYKCLLKYARDGEKYLDNYNDLKDKDESYRKFVAEQVGIKNNKIELLTNENDKLKKDNLELKLKTVKLDRLEKLEAWLPVEIKEKFKEYEKELEELEKTQRKMARGRGRISKSWSNKIENDKDKGMEL